MQINRANPSIASELPVKRDWQKQVISVNEPTYCATRNVLAIVTAVWLLLLVLPVPLYAQTVEVTDEFRKVLKELAKEELRNFVYTRLKEQEPLIAASAYNLIERVVAGDSPEELKRLAILSLLDYAMFAQIESRLRKEYPQDEIVDDLGKPIDAKRYKRLTQVGSLLVYEFLARDSLYITWGGMKRMLSEETKFVTSHRANGNKFGLVLSTFIDSNKQEIAHILELDRFLKTVIVDQSELDSSSIERYKLEFSRIVQKQFASEKELFDEMLSRLRAKLTLIVMAYDTASATQYADIFRTLAPFVYRAAVERFGRIELKYDKEMVSTIIGRLQEIYDENVTGLKYRIGLWAGAFAGGKAWNPPTNDAVIVSLRLNDRLQYTISGSKNTEYFLFVGGFVDALVKELSNTTSNRFFFAGLGFSYQRVSLSMSGFIPTEGQSRRAGVVASVMYDIPIEKLIEVF